MIEAKGSGEESVIDNVFLCYFWRISEKKCDYESLRGRRIRERLLLRHPLQPWRLLSGYWTHVCADTKTFMFIKLVFLTIKLNCVSWLQVFVSPLSVWRRFRGRGSCYGTWLLFYCPIRFQQWWVCGANIVQMYHVHEVQRTISKTLCVCAVAQGLSRPLSGADGWRDPDLSATSAGCERAISVHRIGGAGQGGGRRKTQPHTGTCYSILLTFKHVCKVIQMLTSCFWVYFLIDFHDTIWVTFLSDKCSLTWAADLYI